MFGLLRKLNFSQEKLSLYSLILALETTGISSPDIVPAVEPIDHVILRLKLFDALIDISKFLFDCSGFAMKFMAV